MAESFLELFGRVFYEEISSGDQPWGALDSAEQLLERTGVSVEYVLDIKRRTRLLTEDEVRVPLSERLKSAGAFVKHRVVSNWRDFIEAVRRQNKYVRGYFQQIDGGDSLRPSVVTNDGSATLDLELPFTLATRTPVSLWRGFFFYRLTVLLVLSDFSNDFPYTKQEFVQLGLGDVERGHHPKRSLIRR